MSQNSTAEPSPREWALGPFQRFVDEVHNTQRIVELCKDGVGQVAASPPLVRALMAFDFGDGELSEHRAERLKRSERLATFAEEEIATGFATLHAHATVALWAAFDLMISDVLLVWLEHRRELRSQPPFVSMRVPDDIPPDRAARWLADRHRLNVRFRMDLGGPIDRVEACLAPLGLSGTVDDDLRRRWLEFAEVRHLLAHRSGYVDERFLARFSAARVELGERVRVDDGQFVEFLSCCHEYGAQIIDRAADRLGLHRKARPPGSQS